MRTKTVWRVVGGRRISVGRDGGAERGISVGCGGGKVTVWGVRGSGEAGPSGRNPPLCYAQ